jgi:pyruvate/2-oxoglutarate dehydrogenase complex dihydrolipoamide dehydrogenase (E3) component
MPSEKSMPTEFDAIVIGTGQSGPALARRMASEGWRVAVLERDQPGGTCVNTGCIPTKTLVASAKVAAVARRAAEYGVVLDGPVRVDMRRVKERMRAVSGASRDAVTRGLESNENIRFIRGHGRFAGPDTVRVHDELLRSNRIFINVGARASRPDLPGAQSVPYLDSSSLLALDELPSHLIVVGGSYVGLEFGQMYRRFGSEVTILQRGPRLVPREDEEISTALRQILEREGSAVRVDTECTSIEPQGREIAVRMSCAEGAPRIVGSHLLFAIGRVPNTDDLGLEHAGVETDAQGMIRVDEELRTSAAGIWALGDCNGHGGFTHTSYNDYEIVEANLFGPGARKRSDRIPSYALYTDPPLGRCGMNEREARASGREVLVGRYFMEDVGRAFERGETEGLMKVLVDARTQEILGAALLGIEGDEVMHTLLDLMYARAPYTVVTRAMHVHPTVSEYLPGLFHGLEPLGPAAPGADLPQGNR